MHFHMVEREAIDAIRGGPCDIFIDCDDLKRATRPVPAKYVPHEHINVGAAVGKMGDHLIDSRTPEMGKPPKEFTHTFIYGAYDGHVTFYEPMITLGYKLPEPETWAPDRPDTASAAWGRQSARFFPPTRPSLT